MGHTETAIVTVGHPNAVSRGAHASGTTFRPHIARVHALEPAARRLACLRWLGTAGHGQYERPVICSGHGDANHERSRRARNARLTG